MEQWFDDLAKGSTGGLTRRQVFGRIAGGFGVAVLDLFGVPRRARAGDRCVAKVCEECCRTNFPKGGSEKGECVRLCHQRQGVCGPAVTVACPSE